MEPSTTSQSESKRSHVFWWGLLGVVGLSIALNSAVIAKLGQGLDEDPDGYRTMAVILRNTGVLGRGSLDEVEATAYRPPLYPVLLAGLVQDRELPTSRVAVLHCLLAIGVVVLTAVLARLSGLSDRLSLLAALLVACDPLLLNQSTRLMTETLATFLAVGALVLLALFGKRGSWHWMIPAGATLGLAALCRPTFLPLFPLVAIALLMTRPAPVKHRWAAVVALLLSGMVVLLPWTWRNYAVLGRPVFATTHGGYTLLLGNNREFYDHLSRQPWGTVWDASELDVFVQLKKDEGMSELELDAWLYSLAYDHIRARPTAFVQACLIRIGRLWNLAPHKTDPQESPGRRLLRWTIGGWYLVLFVLAVTGGWRWRRMLLCSPWIWGLAFCFCFTAVHTFYWSNLRMRAPLMPFVCVLAAAAFAPPRVECEEESA